jgi:nitronate monooxygenase
VLDTLSIPIIQGPMLGVSNEALVAAVSNTGGLGSLAASNLSPDAIAKAVQNLRAATDKPFLINLFIQAPVEPDAADVKRAMERLAPWREKFGLPVQSIPNTWAEPFAPQFEALVQAAPPAASFTFGCLTREQVAALQAQGTYVMGTATTVAEARAWAAVGADAICAQGFEAGGHRGTFLKEVGESLVGTLSLVSTIRAAVGVPVVAAGGITDGKAVAAALTLGAAAALVGTAYLLAAEASTSRPWKDALATVGDDATCLTRAFSGRYARGIENAFMRDMRAVEADIPAYPIQNALTQELRAAAAKAGDAEVLSLWAGQSVALAKAGSARDITLDLWRDAQTAVAFTHNRWVKAPLGSKTT